MEKGKKPIRNTVYGYLILVAIASLVIDKAILAPNQSYALSDPDKGIQSRQLIIPPVERKLVRTIPISQRLETIREKMSIKSEDMTNTFHVSTRWNSGGTVDRDGIMDSTTFLDTFDLQGTFKGNRVSKRAGAMISGEVYRIGDQLGGFTFVSIDATSATFRRGEVQIQLNLHDKKEMSQKGISRGGIQF